MSRDDLQARFDGLLEDAIASLPPRVRDLLEEVPVVVLERPTPEQMRDLIQDGIAEAGEEDEICGLHTGNSITERSVDDPASLPEQIHIFRSGIISLAGGWEQEHADDAVYEEIRITLLHEIGHHFGLDEEDLEDLGYE